MTVWEIISNVESLLRQVNSDAKFNAAQCKFILDYCLASVISRNSLNAKSDGRRRPVPILDYSLYQRYELPINHDTAPPSLTLPSTPFAIPDAYGIRSLQVYDEKRASLVTVQVTTYEAASFLTDNQFMPQWQDPVAVRRGDELEFFNLPRSIQNASVVYLGNSELPTLENGDPDWNARYPIPPDLVSEVTQMAVQILLGKLQIGEDHVDDGVSNNRVRS